MQCSYSFRMRGSRSRFRRERNQPHCHAGSICGRHATNVDTVLGLIDNNISSMTELLAQSLQEADVASISGRLAELPDLRLPGQLTRNGAPTSQQTIEYLRALLQRDPGVFLERYGELLAPDELRCFEALRSDYEVDLYLKLAEDAQNPAVRAMQTRNRRAAQMHR